MRASSIFSPEVPAKLLGLCSFASAVGTLNLRSALSGFWRVQHHIVNVSAMLVCRAQLTHLTQLKPYTHWSTAVFSPPTSSTRSTSASGKHYCINFASVGLVIRDASWEGNHKTFIFLCPACSLSVMSPVLSMWQVVDFLFVFFFLIKQNSICFTDYTYYQFICW